MCLRASTFASRTLTNAAAVDGAIKATSIASTRILSLTCPRRYRSREKLRWSGQSAAAGQGRKLASPGRSRVLGHTAAWDETQRSRTTLIRHDEQSAPLREYRPRALRLTHPA